MEQMSFKIDLKRNVTFLENFFKSQCAFAVNFYKNEEDLRPFC